jgi:hypothetical protein
MSQHRQGELPSYNDASLGTIPSDQSTWANGWYVYEDGKIVGPLLADDTFKRSATSPKGHKRMVSRKGFTQWYPLKDFAEMHFMAGKYADQLAKNFASQAPQTIDQGRKIFVPSATERFEPKSNVLGPQADQIKTPAQPVVHVPEGSLSAQSHIETADLQMKSEVDEQPKTSRKEKKKQAIEARRLERQTVKVDSKQKSQMADHVARPITFGDQYLQVASSLRLGKVRNAGVVSFFVTPLTFFGYWAFWVSIVTEEMSWHVTGTPRNPHVLPFWMCLIPGLHLLFAWKLIRMAQATEQENGYRTVWAPLAMVLALIPPFFIHYMQTALNQHWRLHVAHRFKLVA